MSVGKGIYGGSLECNTRDFLQVTQDNSTISFNEIPSVYNVQTKRKFPILQKYPSPLLFTTNKTWNEIENNIKDCLSTYKSLLDDNIAIFSVSGIKSDPQLTFRIYCCLNNDGTFSIEFRRTGHGNAIILWDIYKNIKAHLSPEIDEDYRANLSKDDEPKGKKTRYEDEHNYDDLNK
jgi:hypothetical protein